MTDSSEARRVLLQTVDAVAGREGFSGVVQAERPGHIAFAKAYGLADRAHGIADGIDTQFALASGSKGLTALAVVSLIEDGLLELATQLGRCLGGDLPLIGNDVTVEHLLAPSGAR